MEVKKLDVRSVQWQVIINPNALSGKCMKYWSIISAELMRNKIDFRENITRTDKDAVKLIEDLCNQEKKYFIFVGGDGSANVVVNGIYNSKTNRSDVYLVPFPIGTGNDWLRTHNYPHAFIKIVDFFLEGNFVSHDVGSVERYHQGFFIDNRYFINIAGFGFDAAVISETTKGKSNFYAAATYLFSLIKVVFTYKTKEMTIKAAEKELNEPIFSVVVGICKYNGNGMMQVPMGDPFDGMFDVVYIRKIALSKIIRNVKNLFSGKHIQMEELGFFRTNEVEISGETYPLGEVEGEMLETGNYKVKMMTDRINVLIDVASAEYVF